ncbi:MAG: beta-ketoacyl-[acyl-carrier-protein] synthase family protein [Myxococcota bacterium]|nr:beta-ketoacyl-[acyl-carrier-protein] synthase family protein [Myxococcota bacterium]
MTTHRVVITGRGLQTAFPRSTSSPQQSYVSTVFQHLLAQRSTLRPNPDFFHPDLTHHHTGHIASEMLPPSPMRAVAMAQAAARDALNEARLEPRHIPGGLFLNILYGPPATFRGALSDYSPQASFILRESHSARSAAIAEALGLHGPVHCFVNACAGNHAIGAGLMAIRQGRVPWALVGGAEELSPPAYIAFHQLRLLSERCRPFHAHRDGLVMGEGAGMLLLESLESATARGAPVFAELLACGSSNDAFSLVAPHPEGLGAELAMARALRRGGLAPKDVQYINGHGTGTPLNDAAEAQAIARLFGPTSRQPLTTSIKGNLGHCMGAASAIEAVITTEVLRQQSAPPTRGLDEPDPTLNLKLKPSNTRPINVALSNSFGFGGVNSVLALSRPGHGAPEPPERPVYVTDVALVMNGSLDKTECLEALFNRVPFHNPRLSFEPRELLGRKGLRHADPTSLLLGVATKMGLPHWPDLGPSSCGGVLGVAQPSYETGDVIAQKLQSDGIRMINPGGVPHSTGNSALSWLLMRLGVTGYSATLSDGDCSGLNAITHAASLISTGQADSILAGGVSAWSEGLWRAHRATGLRPEPLAEGAGLVVLRTNPEGALCEVLGHASAFVPREPEQALARVTLQILKEASLPPGEIPWVLVSRPITPSLPNATVITISTTAGDTLGAGGALGLAAGARKVHETNQHALVLDTSPEGFATAVLLRGIQRPGDRDARP